MWYACIHTPLQAKRLVRSISDPNLYFQQESTYVLVLILYIDNLYITGSDVPQVNRFYEQLIGEFSLSYAGTINKHLGVEFKATAFGMLLHQTAYI